MYIVFKFTCKYSVCLFLSLHELRTSSICMDVCSSVFCSLRFVYTCMGMLWHTDMWTKAKTVYVRPICLQQLQPILDGNHIDNWSGFLGSSFFHIAMGGIFSYMATWSVRNKIWSLIYVYGLSLSLEEESKFNDRKTSKFINLFGWWGVHASELVYCIFKNFFIMQILPVFCLFTQICQNHFSALHMYTMHAYTYKIIYIYWGCMCISSALI